MLRFPLMRLFLATGSACGLTACSMLSSDLIDDASMRGARQGERPVCSSTTGSYHVSKSYFRLRVDELETSGGAVSMFRYITVQRRPDRDMGYCLDFNASVTSHDKVRIYKANLSAATVVRTDVRTDVAFAGAKADPIVELEAEIKQQHPGGADLLQTIATDAIDESAYIAKVLIRTLFVGLSGNSGFSTDRAVSGDRRAVRKLDLEYDPFDLQQTAIINDSLRKYGFCVLIEGITFERDSDTIDGYCDDPKRAIVKSQRLGEVLKQAEGSKVERSVRGVLYRPRLPYKVALFVKHNKLVRGGWRLRATEIVEMENISPVLALDVRRAFAAQRKTMVFFDQGVVQNICVYKSSELQQLVEVPLEIARSVVALPANVVQVQINSAANDQKLIAAQKQLVEAQIAHLKLLDAQQKGIASDVDTSKFKSKATADTVESAGTGSVVGTKLEDLLASTSADADYASARAVRLASDTVCGQLAPQNSAVPFATPFGFGDAKTNNQGG